MAPNIIKLEAPVLFPNMDDIKNIQPRVSKIVFLINLF